MKIKFSSENPKSLMRISFTAMASFTAHESDEAFAYLLMPITSALLSAYVSLSKKRMSFMAFVFG
jgi:hypothetical protein